MKKFLSVFAGVTTVLAAIGGAAYAVKKILDKKAEDDLFEDFEDEDIDEAFETVNEDETDESKREYVSIHISNDTADAEEDVAEFEEEAVENTDADEETAEASEDEKIADETAEAEE